MTTVRQMYDLQEVDVEIDWRKGRISSIDGHLGDRVKLDRLTQERADRRASLNALRLAQRARELDAGSVREKIQQVEARLYGGEVTNLREIEGHEREAASLKIQMKGLDDQLLESMVGLEEAQKTLRSLEKELARAEEEWRVSQGELVRERQRLADEVADLETRRGELASAMGQQELKLYEGLRSAKGGQAIAKVERGLCRGCRMALPTHQLQRARGGRERVLCNSCGRILYVS